MKKFFVFLLLVSLLPFSVGCRLFDVGDDKQPAVPTIPVKAAVVIPAAAISGLNIRADIITEGWTLTINGVALMVSKITDNGDETYTVEFEANLTVEDYDKVKAEEKVDIVIETPDKQQIKAKAQIGNPGEKVTITVEKDAVTGSFAVKKIEIQVKQGEEPVPAIEDIEEPEDYVAPKFYTVTGIFFNEELVSKEKANPTVIHFPRPFFFVEFSEEIEEGDEFECEFSVQKIDPESTTVVTLTEEDLFLEIFNGGIGVEVENEEHELQDGSTYKVTLKKATLTRGETEMKLTTPAARYIKFVQEQRPE